MNKVLQWVAGLIVLFIVGVAAFVGEAINRTWRAENTELLVWGGIIIGVALIISGGSVVKDLITALASRRRPVDDFRPPLPPTVGPAQITSPEWLRWQKQQVDLERSQLALTREQQRLLPAAPVQQAPDPLDEFLRGTPAPGWPTARAAGAISRPSQPANDLPDDWGD